MAQRKDNNSRTAQIIGIAMKTKTTQEVSPAFLALVRTIIQQNLESLKELAKH